MSGDFPPVVIKKFFSSVSQSCIDEAQKQLNEAIGLAFPELDLGKVRSATPNDIQRSATGISVTSEHNLYLFFAGTRITRLGPYLLASIEPPSGEILSQGGLGKQYFVQAMVGVSQHVHGIVLVSQTPSDNIWGGSTIGRRSDVFSYLLGRRAGLDSVYLGRDETSVDGVFLFDRLAKIGEEAFIKNGVVEIRGLFSGRFLRECFKEISRTLSRAEFRAKFGEFGVRWHPRFSWF